MRLRELYQLIVQIGIEEDPRGKDLVQKELERNKGMYEKLSPAKKETFDLESLENPYTDTRILFGDEDREIQKIMIGVDIEVGEILLADRLNERGEKIDLLMAHHPEGRALAGIYKVMELQTDVLNRLGVSVNVAEELMRERIKEVERTLSPLNHTRSVDAARLLNIPFMCCHTVSDNCVATYLQKIMDKRSPRTVAECMDILYEIPEYKESAKQNAGPILIKGQKTNRAGRIFVDMTGGTEGSKNVFSRLTQAGVGTVICMHLAESHFKKAKEEPLNIIIAGHISSDNLGMNLLLDKVLKRAKFNIVPCSGYIRFERNQI